MPWDSNNLRRSFVVLFPLCDVSSAFNWSDCSWLNSIFLIVPVGNNPSGTFMPLYIISHTPGLIFAIPSISWGDRCKYLLRSCFK